MKNYQKLQYYAKKNAPVIWDMTIGRRIKQIEYEINTLKAQYQREEDSVKREAIVKQARVLKAKLREIEG